MCEWKSGPDVTPTREQLNREQNNLGDNNNSPQSRTGDLALTDACQIHMMTRESLRGGEGGSTLGKST